MTEPVNTVIHNGIGTTVWAEADDLDDYEFELGDEFVRWAPWGDERKDDDRWKVTDIEWQYKTTWVTNRDNPTTRRDHRVYVLTSRETFDEVRKTEKELMMGDWRATAEIDDLEAET